MENKLLVSFSAGETSAFMAAWLKKNHSTDIIFVFANTGEENEETLIFADKCDKYFNLNLVWVEADVIHEKGKGTKHKVVSFETATRSGLNGSFEEYIKKFGIPNYQNQTCTRELKERPITSYARSIGWKKRDYNTAIGIRIDEIDRVSINRKKNNLTYPLIEDYETTKGMVNSFWNKMPFRLNLKGYEGNCKTCWKKSFRKLATIAIDTPQDFKFCETMELKYSDHVPTRDRNKLIFPLRFFRGNNSTFDIIEMSRVEGFSKAEDDKFLFSEIDKEFGCIGSCESFN